MGYFGNILSGIKTTAQGLKITGTYLGKNLGSRGKKTFALQYPDEHLPRLDVIVLRGDARIAGASGYRG